jgi:hypothetical protein
MRENVIFCSPTCFDVFRKPTLPSRPSARPYFGLIGALVLVALSMLGNNPFGAFQMDEESSSGGPSTRQVEGEEVDVDVSGFHLSIVGNTESSM